MPSQDVWLRLGEIAAVLSALVAIGVPVVRAAHATRLMAERVMSVLRDFPPHRHINGRIVYPDGFEPSTIENLTIATAASKL